ncbi:hypothetical protein HPB50_011693 [Hyalomma asiaticum]|uniref:Uncharacterized protein n=1 Tax=Hyalomma asiaticum TaxID=266040 RepID=A0ACB7SQB4_HYAAI|nr:hypothetical protein HPB50_011693 [Hyalomma asiaticum]
MEVNDAELWMRSAGDRRISGVMLWQSSYAYLIFHAKQWPCVGFWDWILALLKFQVYGRNIMVIHAVHATSMPLEKPEGPDDGGNSVCVFAQLLHIALVPMRLGELSFN